MQQFDFVVLGSGIAGLSFALKVAPRGRVAIITKKNRAESNTNYAQGGIAAVTSKEDSFELHVRDTLEAGAGLCKENVVRTIIEEGQIGRAHELQSPSVISYAVFCLKKKKNKTKSKIYFTYSLIYNLNKKITIIYI